jgi:hypothetical protein
MSLALALALCFVSGYFAVASVWPRLKTSSLVWLLKVSLAIGFGFGIFSVAFVLELVFGITHIVFTDGCITAVPIIVFLLLRTRSGGFYSISSEVPDFKLPNWIGYVAKVAFAISIVTALYASVCRALAHPHGEGWDAFAIWNLHARFLFLGGAHWRDGFSALIPWSHADYPLLIPAAIAHFWSYLGQDYPAVPATVALIFTFTTLALLVSSLAILRGVNSAILGGIALAATPFFIEQGASQYVDVPLSFFFLAAIALSCFHQRVLVEPQSRRRFSFLILAGLTAGFAAWTKNEGLLFLFAFLAAHIAGAVFKPQPKSTPDEAGIELTAFALATVPALVLIACFKHAIAPPGDLFTSPTVTAHRLLTPTRYWIVLQWYVKEFFRFGNWWIVPGTVLLPVFYFLARSTRRLRSDWALRSCVITLGLTLAGYFAVYVITPYNIYWHLRFSLNRLFLQLWPSIIFLFFLFVGRQTPAISQSEPSSCENSSYYKEIHLFPLTCRQNLVINIRSIRTSLGVCKFGGSQASRGRIVRERPSPLQTQGAAGRHYQGGQAPLLLPEARRKKACKSCARS